MNQSAGIASIVSLITNPLLVPVGAVLVAILLYMLRAGSGHILLERIWMFVAKGIQTKDEKIAAFSQELSDVDKFRFLTGINTEKMSEVYCILQLIKEYDLSLKSVIFARRWIKPNTDEIIKKPSRRYLGLYISVLILGYLITVASIELRSKNALLIRVNSTDNFYYLKKDSYSAGLFLNTVPS